MSSKNGRFHPLKKDVASPSKSLFDIIITIVVVLIIVHDCHQQDNYYNQCNRCPSFILPSLYL